MKAKHILILFTLTFVLTTDFTNAGGKLINTLSPKLLPENAFAGEKNTTTVVSNYQKLVNTEKNTADLVVINKLDNTFVIDLKYASTDNFTGKRIYSQPICLIHRNTAQKLISANNDFKKLGYRIKIFDAYRPYSAQKILYDAAENKTFLADPKKGSHHNRGAAVDITLVDRNGEELPMPSHFDEFSQKSRINYYGSSQKLINNRELLGWVMVKHGFKRIGNEWWHFEDTEAKKYPLLDIPFEAYNY